MEDPKRHFRHVMLFYFKKGKNASQTAAKICAVYGDNSVSDDTVRRWFAKFREGDFTLQDLPRSGRKSKVNDEKLKDVVSKKPSYTVENIAKELKVPKSTIHDHLRKLGYVGSKSKVRDEELKDVMTKKPRYTIEDIARDLMILKSTEPDHLRKLEERMKN